MSELPRRVELCEHARSIAAVPGKETLIALLEDRDDAVVQNAAASASPHLRGPALATRAILGLLVPATVLLLLMALMAEQSDVALLTPGTAPGVLDVPIR